MSKSKEFVEKFVAQVRSMEIPEEHAGALEKALATAAKTKPYIGAELGDDDVKPGQSKVGGLPDMPEELDWPTEAEDEDAPLQFLAQVNLAEVHPHDLEGRLPAKGMLWFFSIADGDRAYGGEIDDATTRVIFAPEPGRLKSRPAPEEIAENEDAAIEEHPLVFGPMLDFGDRLDGELEDLLEEALFEVGGRKGPLFMLNDRGGSEGLMLADFDGYAIAPNAFGEGVLGFGIAPKNLTAGKLARTETYFSGGT